MLAPLSLTTQVTDQRISTGVTPEWSDSGTPAQVCTWDTPVINRLVLGLPFSTAIFRTLPIVPNSVSWAFADHSTRIEPWKQENIIINRLPRFWRLFSAFSAVSETTLSCSYPLTELHETRFLGLLQAIPPESNLGNRKTS